MSTLYHTLRAVAVQRPEHTAIIEYDGSSICYQTLFEEIERLSNVLLDRLKGKARPHVGLLMDGSIAQIVTVFSLSKINAVVVPLNPKLKGEQICHVLSVTGVLLLIVDESCEPSCNFAVEVSSYEDLIESSIAMEHDAAISSWNEDSTFLVTLSSGSTGNPKPIMLSEQVKLKRVQQTWDLYDITKKDVVLCASPFFHSLGQRLTFVPLLKGATLVLMGRFTPQRWIDQVAAEGVTFTICVSSHLYALREQLVSQSKRLHSLHALVSSSAAIDRELKEYLFEQVGCAFYEIYGATEVAIATNLEPKDAAHKSASVGEVCAGVKVMILNAQHQPLPAGEVGEIACRSPLMFSGYLNQPEQTEVVCHQGYFLTGDLGYLDEDGFLYFVSRKKDVIVSGGSNIYPVDIEMVVLESTSITECAVVGINDSYLGEVVIAVCVWQQGEEQNEWKLRQWVNSQLSPFQRPLKYFFIEQLPLTSTGKLNKRALRGEYNRLGLDLSEMVRAFNAPS
jgi:long-chain acyl-CoA synthetase